jgi:hypothetical protein
MRLANDRAKPGQGDAVVAKPVAYDRRVAVTHVARSVALLHLPTDESWADSFSRVIQ